MRVFIFLPLLVLAWPALAQASGDLRYPDDASLRAVQFVDEREGWAIGDEGVVWHSTDGGNNWERQPTGVRASLHSLHFLNPWVGWVVGRQELSGGGSVGVVLYTRDGGLSWRQLMLNSLPGLHLVRFVDDKTGYLAGEGSDQFPSGVFATTDGGRSWLPVPGPRATAWRGGDFDAEGGALGGAWNRIATVRRGKVHQIEMDSLGGRAIRGVQMRGEGGVAVGQGGLVLIARQGRGAAWDYADIKLPREVRSVWDFHSVSGVGQHIWATGRPGSVALHSPDMGKSWELVRTGQEMPLHGVFFLDEKRGWAVGELGVVVATKDGGKTWEVRKRGGQRMGLLSVSARPANTPLDTTAILGLQDGYLMAGLCVTAPEPGSSSLARVGESARLEEAFRQAGGAAASMLWQFPLPSHLSQANRDDLLKAWDALHGDQSAQELLAQLVLAIRMYRPQVLLTDPPQNKISGAEALVAEGMKEAFTQAGDEKAFPEQLRTLGLKAWKPRKLYAGCADGANAPVRYDLTELSPRLGSSVREFATAPQGLLGPGVPPAMRCYRLLASELKDASAHRDLMTGAECAVGGEARRKLPVVEELSAEEKKSAQTRANLWAIAEAPASALTTPDRLLAQLGPALEEMPIDVGARVVHGLASQHARKGQWTMARETYLLLVTRYPTHELSVDARRWLLMHNASSEARRRYELGQFLVMRDVELGIPMRKQPSTEKTPAVKDGKLTRKADAPDFVTKEQNARFEFADNFEFRQSDVRRWFEGALTLNAQLAKMGPLYGLDRSMQFCVQSARRQLGDAKGALEFSKTFAAEQPDGPWKRSALAELWLANRVGDAPKPAIYSRPTAARPYLDGKLDDACWQEARPVALKDASSKLAEGYASEVRMCYDRDFVYVAVRCGHPEGEGTPAAPVKTRDTEMRRHDRIGIMLDLDRDYSTYFHLQIDASGCVAEDCWGDTTWNPRWFAAIERDKTAWTVEMAIPRDALSGDHITPGRAWAANVVRVLPNKGVQAMSLPAEAPEVAMRPEGMGLLLFLGDEARKAQK